VGLPRPESRHDRLHMLVCVRRDPFEVGRGVYDSAGAAGELDEPRRALLIAVAQQREVVSAESDPAPGGRLAREAGEQVAVDAVAPGVGEHQDAPAILLLAQQIRLVYERTRQAQGLKD